MEIHVESPFPVHALPRVWVWAEKFRSRICDDSAPRTLDEFVADWESRQHRLSWGVVCDGELGGLVVVDPVGGGVAETYSLFRPDCWPRAAVALQAAYREAFGSGLLELRSMVFRDNKAVMALLRQVGARRKALVYGAAIREGRPRDMYLMSVTPDALPADPWGAARS